MTNRNISMHELDMAPSLDTRNPVEKRYNCFFCDDDKYHMYVNFAKDVYFCQKCSTGGKILKQNITVNLEDYKTQVEDFFVDKTKPQTSTPKPKLVKSLPLNTFIGEVPVDHPAIQYLERRGVPLEQMTRYDLRLSREHSGPYRDTIIFPVINRDINKLDYFVARRYTEQEPKYVNAPWKKETLLVNMPTLTYYSKAPIVIVEGVLDAFAILRHQFPVACLLGKTANDMQLLDIKRKLNPKKHKFIIYLDHDAFGKAIDLKLKLNEMEFKSVIMLRQLDAADSALSQPKSFAYHLRVTANELNKK